MWLFKKYKKTVSFVLNQAPDAFLQSVLEHVKNAKRKDDLVMVQISPSFLNPFAGQGVIVIHSKPNDQCSSTVTCELIPISEDNGGLYFFLFLLLLWSLASLTVYYGPFSVPMVIIGWVIAILGIHILLTWTMNKLENKLNKMMKILRLSHVEMKAN